MSNAPLKQVGVEFVAEGAQAYQGALDAITLANQKLAVSFTLIINALKNAAAAAETINAGSVSGGAQSSGASVSPATTTAQRLLDLEIAYAREKGNTAKAQELINKGLADAEITEARQISLLDKQVEVQKEIAAQILAANAQVLVTQQKQAASMAIGLLTPAETQRQIDLEIRLALARGDDTEALRLNAQAQVQAADDTERLLRLQIQQENIQSGLVASTGNVTREARGLRDGIFGAALAITLLQSTLGDALPPAAKQASQSLRLVADTMLAVAFLAPESGPLGLALGAAAGLLVALGVSALAGDADIQALNKSLDALAKKEDAAQGLAKLSNVSYETATAALEAAKKNQDFGDKLTALAKASEKPIPVLQGLGDVFRLLGDAIGYANHAAELINPNFKATSDALQTIVKDGERGLAFFTAFNEAIKQGKNAQEALIIAIVASENATRDLTTQNKANLESTIALGLAQKQTADYFNDAAKALDALTTKDKAVDVLVELGRVESDTAQKAIAFAKQHENVAVALQMLEANVQRAYTALRNGTGSVQDLTNALQGLHDGITAIAGQGDFEALSKRANKFAQDIQAINQKSEEEILRANADYQTRLQEIDANGVEARIAIAERLAARLREINAQLADDEIAAAQSRDQALIDADANAAEQRQTLADELAIAIADAEEVAAERRVQINQDYADKIVQIEQDYRDKIARIQEDYAASLFEIVARDDAKGLVLARLKREKELADAEKARQKQEAEAEKAREKAQKALDDALRRQEEKLRDNEEKALRRLERALADQKKKIEEAYEKRIAALEAQAEKERQKAIANSSAELIAQGIAQTKSEASAYASLQKKQRDIEQANRDRIRAITTALEEEYQANIAGAQRIIAGLRSVLSPSLAAQIMQNFTDALQANIQVTVTPFAPQNNPTQVVCPQGYVPDGNGGCMYVGAGAAVGGVVAQTGIELVHANETILPVDNPERAYELATLHMERVNMPLGARGGWSGSAGGGEVMITIDNSVNSALLDSQIQVVSTGVVTNVIRRARR